MRFLDLVDAARQNSLPKRAVVVTFDDGYVDNFYQAHPILQFAQIPATVFVTSGQIDNPYGFWCDELERVLLLTEYLPSRLRLCVQDKEYRWSTTSARERQVAHRSIYRLLKPLPAVDQLSVLGYLADWAGVERTKRSDYRAMTSAELIQLARDGLVEVGAHTVTHPTLSAFSADAQYQEIVGSRQTLEAIIGSPVLAFAYPYGMAQDFTEETVKIVEAAGFRAACTAIPGTVEAGHDLFRLPRHWVHNWDLETFKQNLESYFVA
jgi:peptidoglycan/xylan/chitin deacetylase (PgdA/CDA1 family)